MEVELDDVAKRGVVLGRPTTSVPALLTRTSTPPSPSTTRRALRPARSGLRGRRSPRRIVQVGGQVLEARCSPATTATRPRQRRAPGEAPPSPELARHQRPPAVEAELAERTVGGDGRWHGAAVSSSIRLLVRPLAPWACLVHTVSGPGRRAARAGARPAAQEASRRWARFSRGARRAPREAETAVVRDVARALPWRRWCDERGAGALEGGVGEERSSARRRRRLGARRHGSHGHVAQRCFTACGRDRLPNCWRASA